jgi:hypothetical protein
MTFRRSTVKLSALTEESLSMNNRTDSLSSRFWKTGSSDRVFTYWMSLSQLSFLLLLRGLLEGNPDIRFIIATHSPLILAYPESQILSFDGAQLTEIAYEESSPYNIVQGFLKDPKLYLKHLFAELPLE